METGRETTTMDLDKLAKIIFEFLSSFEDMGKYDKKVLLPLFDKLIQYGAVEGVKPKGAKRRGADHTDTPGSSQLFQQIKTKKPKAKCTNSGQLNFYKKIL